MGSGMDYQGMNNLIKYIEQKAASINTLLTSDLPGLVPEIADAYTGTAAEEYKNTLKKTADDMGVTLTNLIKNLREKTDEWQAAYKDEERKLAESVKPVKMD